jgi:hypothetical protein
MPRLATGDWSRDGVGVGFESQVGHKAFVGNAENGTTSQLGAFANNVVNVIWSPDGKIKYISLATPKGDEIWMAGPGESDRKMDLIIPDVATFMVRAAPDGKSILYAVPGETEAVVYRLPWKDGKITGPPEVALKIPFTFQLERRGNAYDFSRDLSRIVYARPSAQMDLYALSYE